MGKRLTLLEFKELYRRLHTGVVAIDHLLLAVLYYLEQQFLNLRVETSVNHALHSFERREAGEDWRDDVVYSQQGDDFFDELRLTSSKFDKNL
jgi:hypothetical protein